MSARSLRLHPALCTILLASLAGPASAAAQRLAPAEIRSQARAVAPQALDAFREYLALPNDANRPEDLRKVIDWLTVEFEQRGFTTKELETGRIPVLFAAREVPGARRTLLVYLQADGQPVDPARWHQRSPYEPVLRERAADGTWRDLPWNRLEGAWNPEWRIFARSTADSKAQNIGFLAAVTALDAARVTPDFTIKVIVDTEEEMGSPNLAGVVERYREQLAADWLVIFDGPRHPTNRPTLTFGARGIATFTLTTHGPRVPQHSGHYGNWVPNPALRLAQILASMKDDRGYVTIPGFYDGVVLDDATRAALAGVPDDEAAIKRDLGIVETDTVGATLQQARQYPSINVRGMASAWIGAQSRTIVPATATAEVDVRLVKESDPARLLELIRRHIEGLGYSVIDREPTEEERLRHARIATFTATVSYAAYRTEIDSDVGNWLSRAMVHLYGEEPVKIRTSGGSIPIAPFVETLGVPAVTVPTVNPDNNQHSPNENVRLGNFVEGIEVMLAILAQPVGRR